MKKESTQVMVVTFFVFVALLGFTSLFNNTAYGLTGNVVMDRPVDGQIAIQELLRLPEFETIGSGAKICINVKVSDDEIRGYKIRKNGELFKIVQSESYCDGSGIEDIVITFENYGSLLNAKKIEDLNFFRLPSIEDDVKLWQSRFIRIGGIVKQNKEFDEKYCEFLVTNFEKDLRMWGINCEIDADSESPSIIMGFFGKYWWMLLIGLFVCAIAFIGVTLYSIKDASDDDVVEETTLLQLHDYILQSRKLECGDYQIKNALLKSGWDEKTINMAFDSVRKFHLSSIVDRFEKIIELPFANNNINIEEDYEEEEEFDF